MVGVSGRQFSATGGAPALSGTRFEGNGSVGDYVYEYTRYRAADFVPTMTPYQD
ncbi:MAG: hypothetical protein IPL33_21095 [Sphingobacteriales bacterium]|nr:hypothetical protein [Sphingobacteriales bacterium]